MNSKINEVKKLLTKNDDWEYLFKLITETDLRNPYSNHSDEWSMWQEQCYYNFPILYLGSIYVYLYAKKNNCKRFLFATRDCCHWYKIFTKMFPDEICHYFNCSRNMFSLACNESHPLFKNYVESLVEDEMDQSIYVDIHGSGQHLFKYIKREFKETPPYCFLLSSGCENKDDFPTSVDRYRDHILSLIFKERGGHIEMLNYDLVGTMQNYSVKGPIRDKPEYSLEQIAPYHKCINSLVNKLLPINVEVLEDYSIKNIHELIVSLFALIQSSRPVIGKSIHHIGRHKKNK